MTVKVTIPSILDCVQQKQSREEDLEEKAREIETDTKAEENKKTKIINLDNGQDDTQENR